MAEEAQDLAHALADEFAAIHAPAEPVPDEPAYRRRAAELEQAALCLSGGGVRSAAFSLGVVQALARARLLARFDYLSTVSGGGFTGGWLSALIAQQGGAAEAEAVLQDEAPRAVRALREYTNYLTPDRGLLSADTWSGIVLYGRNVLINWFAFGPVFLLAVLAAIFYRTFLWWFGMLGWGVVAALIIAAAALVLATWRACLDLPSHRPEQADGGPDYLSAEAIQRWIVVPALIWAFCIPMTLSRWLGGADSGALGFAGQAWLPLLYVAAMLAGYAGAATRQREPGLYVRNALPWVIATLTTAVLVWIGLRLTAMVPLAERAEALAVAGPLWLVLANVLQATAFIGLRREAKYGELDREWLARLSAVKLRIVVLWAVFAFCCLSLQRFAFHARADWPFWAVPLITAISGPSAAWLGKQLPSGLGSVLANARLRARAADLALPVLGLLFAAGLFTLLGYVMGEVLGTVQTLISPNPGPALLVAVQAAVAAVLGFLLWDASRRININRFSMHGVYRNRITRAFLGAARAARRPDPFTGFDPADNPRMAALLRARPRKLFPVINVTLNLTASGRTAWAERKAAAFTITPLACGSPALDVPGRMSADPAGCYVPSAAYAGQEREAGEAQPMGVSLASAVTISGAAVSPNWGYHSSPVTAFLMTLFNVRLGAWLPNPAVVRDVAELQLASPRNALTPMLNDLLGTTSARTRGIYLSDGGHFDNLGLYEMLRRRCRLILVVDAGQDFACDFADLGNALRKAAIDQQIHVEFRDRTRICARSDPAPDALDFAVGTITWPEGGPAGRLLYLKPCYLDDIPTDVRAYGATHPEFPHETTLDQWFTESQFESYRRLGEHQMNRLTRLLPEGQAGLRPLFEAADVEEAGLRALFAAAAGSQAAAVPGDGGSDHAV